MGDPLDDIQNAPWERGNQHEVIECSNGIVKCTECGKYATEAAKLANTPCESEFDRTGSDAE